MREKAGMHHRTEHEIMQNWKSDFDTPIVSICCITYNHENYIAQALDSMLMQETNFPFEIIVRDDCSTDKTASIIGNYMEKYPHVIKPIFEQENQYSKGIKPLPVVAKNAIGKYIALCEGDDYWTDPVKLQKQFEFLENNTEYALCYTGIMVIDERINKVLLENKHFGDSSSDELIAGIGDATTSSIMYRKFDLDEYSTFNVMNGDSLLWHFLGFYGKCKYISDIENGVHIKHDGGIWGGCVEQSKLSYLLETYTAIRNRIVLKCGKDSHLIKMHDTLYPNIFHTYLFFSLSNLEMKQYFFGLSKLRELKHLNRKEIYMYHVNKMLHSIPRSIKRMILKKK